MLYAFKLGPIQTGDGEMTGFFAMTPERALEPRFGSAAAALRSFVKESGTEVLRCDSSLGRVGKPLGFVVDEAPEWAAVPRAILAFGLALGNMASPFGAAIAPFLEATRVFLDAAPWQHWDNGDVIEVVVTRGSRVKTYEGCIMGAGGLEFGLALYPEKGSIARLSRASMAEARAVDSIALTVDDEPDWARDALFEGFGIDAVPVPIRLAKGRPGRVPAEDLATLTVALRAVADLSPTVKEAESSLDDLVARVRAPRPRARR